MNPALKSENNIIQLPVNNEIDLRKELFDILSYKKIRTVFQPIIDLKSAKVYGYEALTRGPIYSSFHSPIQLFKHADENGLLYSLEKLSRELAFENSTSIVKKNEKIFINLSPQVIYDPNFTPGHTMSLLEQYRLSPENIVFEITERSAIEDFSAFTKVLYHYRNQGFQIAVDDAGAGYSSLQAISEIQPDYIKVDRSLISQIDKSDIKKHMLDAFTTFSRKMNAIIIAEGIERKEELETVIQLGIDCGQGYLIAVPSFPVNEIEHSMVEIIRNNKRKQRKEPISVQLDDELLIMDGEQLIKKLTIQQLLETK